MAKADLTITVRIADMERVLLFVWELRQLTDEMRVAASPHAERLEHALDRFLVDLHGDEPDGATEPQP